MLEIVASSHGECYANPMAQPSFLRPPATTLQRFLASQSRLGFSYSAVGATANQPPAGFLVDHTRIVLGCGEQVFTAAQAALRRWDQFRLGWVEAWPADAPLVVGEQVAVMGWSLGIWWTNACRIVYVVDECGPIQRFGFAYGTLPGHVESGEERFLLEWNRHTNEVAYEILAFSRPNHPLTRLGYPLVRRLQARFGRDSARALFRACGGSAAAPAIVQTLGYSIR